ncbi:hypothetical protein VP1G_03748 [Cytospora mali]|uniref:Uncharacterized protein n=1 Tax=Cytospora mali TaxID=578113 RepID=A0A194UXG4_CYTMA|nr:hypothetical protein VP1G_03748 [Valsa mali var. pyri (nom. inval.)]
MAAASQHKTVDELFHALERSQEQYLKNLKSLHEAMHGAARSPSIARSHRMERGGSNDKPPASPILRPGDSSPLPVSRATFSSDLSLSPGDRRPRRLTNELADRRRLARLTSGELDGIEWEIDDDVGKFAPLPLLPASQTQSSSSTTGEPICWPRVQKILIPKSYKRPDLVRHLQQLPDGNETTAAALGDVFARRKDLDTKTVFKPGPDPLNVDNESSTYEVYDINTEGLAVTRHDDKGSAEDEVLGADVVWGTIKDVNLGKKTVGRITIFQEATPAMLAGIHLVMNQHFDMDELFSHLVSPHGKTTAYMHRAAEPNRIHQRSFFFVFKYYTVVGEGLTPAPWQQYDHRPPDTKSPDHIDITECSSILALSLEGDPVKEVPLRRRRRKGVTSGVLYDTFAPFHLLNIQCFPDHIHSENDSIRKPCYYNGPYVFLNRLVAEYRDATKRYLQLNDRIRKLITPPYQFMFDPKLRDKLLFEDADFTFSRRYFWAYNSLGVMDVLRQELEHAVEDLKAVVKANEQVRQEIVSLREQLFSGSSVKESRRAIEQGDNIKILTGVSMLFLPLTFSVFGITEFTFSANDWRFPVTMVSVCVPFFLLIFILQTRAGMRAVKKVGDFTERNMGRWSDRSRSRHERRLQLQQQLMQAAESQRQSSVVSIVGGGGGGGGAGAGTGGGGGRRRVSLRRGGKKRRLSGGSNDNGVGGLEPMVFIDGLPVGQERWWAWRRKKAEDMLGNQTGLNV